MSNILEIIEMAIAQAGAAYRSKLEEFREDADRIQAIWEGNPTLDEVVEVYQRCQAWMEFWAEWGHPAEQEFCRQQLAHRQAEAERVQALARKLIERDYPEWAQQMRTE